MNLCTQDNPKYEPRLTSDVLQCYSNSSRHFARCPKSPETQLLIRSDSWTHCQNMKLNSGYLMNPKMISK